MFIDNIKINLRISEINKTYHPILNSILDIGKLNQVLILQ
jgi:hypothetical protein